METEQQKVGAPPLTDLEKPWGIIKFIHSDGKEHKFYVATNELSGSVLSAFDSDSPDIDQPLAFLKTVFRDIRKKAKVVSYHGTKHFAKIG